MPRSCSVRSPSVLAAVLALAASAAAQSPPTPVAVPLWTFSQSLADYLRGFEASITGEEVSALGDIDADGVGDLVVGDRWADTVRVVSGKPAYSWVSSWYPQYVGTLNTLYADLDPTTVSQVSGSTFFGFDVANAGDIDGDGADDVFAGAPLDGNGKAFLFSGASGTLLAIYSVDSSHSISGFGWDVKGLGDIDGNGTPDLAVGAINNGASVGGRVYIFWGENALTSSLGTCTSPACHTTLHAAATLFAESPYDQTNNQYGVNIAPLGDTDGNSSIDGLLVGAPGTASGGFSYRGAAFAYTYDNSGGNTSVYFPFKPRTFSGGGSMIFFGIGNCSLLGFDTSCVGDLDGDGLPEFMTGSMGRHPGDSDANPNSVCAATGFQAGYARIYDGATGCRHAQTFGTAQSLDQERYGAYVAGDADLDSDARDCDFDGDGVRDYVVSSYRKKMGGTGAPNIGALTLYSGASAVNSPSNLCVTPPVLASPTPIYGTPFTNLFLGGNGTMDGLYSGGFFGEALAILPWTDTGDFPRLGVYEYTTIRVIAPFGAMTLPLHVTANPTPSDDPTLNWASSASHSQPWYAGSLEVSLSSTAASASYIWIVPSLTLANVTSTTQASGVEPPTINGYSLYTYLPSTVASTALPVVGGQVLDVPFGNWVDVIASNGGSVSNGQSVSIPFSLSATALASQFPSNSFASLQGAHIYLQLVEVYAAPPSGMSVPMKASNLLIVKGPAGP